MNTTVLKLSKVQLDQLKAHYAAFTVPNKNPYTLFVAKKGGVTITGYTSGKVVFQGTNASTEAAIWQKENTAVRDKKHSQKNNITTSGLPKDFAQKSIIGSDEVGNGSYFGPLVVCAVYAANENLPYLKKIGVKDSKMLTDHEIRHLAPKIKATVPFQKLVVTPAKYNEIQPKYNAVRMKVALHNQAIYLLQQKIMPAKAEGILIDQFTTEANYRKYLQQEKNQVTSGLHFVTKGEQYHLSVAAASILCRASFLAELEAASQELGFTVPSGAGSKSDLVAAKILQQGGIKLLANYAKLHFANTQKAQKLAGY
ncbi:ribonuclease HIII [Enterococcus saigonensis]|uniref:Ribonuclease HIII n=1 Tax=Enterococcus saigonensis TaxID=1805431 RepID=A0A679IDB6_9ENTE|nr:ribonuclease HIII [Enterococcus saigonensis]BCA86239.1 ribonuclease HIII [Enterococcus saigonensis]